MHQSPSQRCGGLTQVTRHKNRPQPLLGQRAGLKTALPRGDALFAPVGSGIRKSFVVGRLWFLAYVCHLELSFQDESCPLSSQQLVGVTSS